MQENSFQLDCDCGCNKIVFSYWDGELVISHYALSFYRHQKSIWNTIKTRISLLWCIITGKEYRLYETVIPENKFEEFKIYINNVKKETYDKSAMFFPGR